MEPNSETPPQEKKPATEPVTGGEASGAKDQIGTASPQSSAGEGSGGKDENTAPKPEGKGGEDEEESALKEWVELLVRAAGWALVIYVFIFQISVVDGDSMVPTYHHGDRLVIDKVTYRVSDVKRFDTVVFEAVDVDKVPRRPRDYIKRVIGLPGEKVELKEGAFWIDGVKLDDPYGPAVSQTYLRPDEVLVFVVPKGQYFVVGDNRMWSKDSRDYPAGHVDGRQSLGFVARRQIRGLVRLRFMPLKDWQWFSRGR
jgi:signal peptidase I